MTSHPKQIFRNDYYTVLLDERLRLVRAVRSAKPFASMAELETSFAQLISALDALDRPRYALLSDVRAVPGRNDPEFEAALARVRPLWLSGFRKVGVLVQSSIGLLQVQRYARKDGLVRKVSNDETELLEYLLSPEA